MLISRGKKGRNESCVSRYLQQQCKHRREGNMIRIILKKKKRELLFLRLEPFPVPLGLNEICLHD